MPRNTGAGIILAGAARGRCGFALIWYMWWLAVVGFVARARRPSIGHTFNYNRDYHIPADEVVARRGRSARDCSPAELND